MTWLLLGYNSAKEWMNESPQVSPYNGPSKSKIQTIPYDTGASEVSQMKRIQNYNSCLRTNADIIHHGIYPLSYSITPSINTAAPVQVSHQGPILEQLQDMKIVQSLSNIEVEQCLDKWHRGRVFRRHFLQLWKSSLHFTCTVWTTEHNTIWTSHHINNITEIATPHQDFGCW